MIYNFVLISAIQQSDSVKHTYTFFFLYSFPLWFIIIEDSVFLWLRSKVWIMFNKQGEPHKDLKLENYKINLHSMWMNYRFKVGNPVRRLLQESGSGVMKVKQGLSKRKYNASHVCNFYFPNSYVRKSQKKKKNWK